MIMFEDISVSDAVVKMSDGNRESLAILLRLMQAAPDVNPQDYRRELFPVLALDDMKIYGDRIRRLFHGTCHDDVLNMFTLLQGRELGMVNRSDIMQAASGVCHEFAFDVLRSDIKSIIPEFCVATSCAKAAILYERY